MITKFDKENIKELHEAFNDFCKVIEEEYGIKVTTGTLRYDNSSFKMAISAFTLNDESENSSISELKWRKNYEKNFFALTFENLLGRRAIIDGTPYILIGSRLKTDKNLVLKCEKTGRFVSSTASFFKQHLV